MRKILKVCRGVLEYLSVAEIVESMEELVTFVKNLTPGITEMAKKVEARIEELTHQVHADMLKKSITAVKAMSTQLITSIKTYVLTVQRGNKMNQYYCDCHVTPCRSDFQKDEFLSAVPHTCSFFSLQL